METYIAGEQENEKRANETEQEKLGALATQPVNNGDKQQPETEKKRTHPANSDQKNPPRWYQGWKFEKDVIDTITSILGIVALIFLIYQSCELQETNEIAAKSLRLADSSFVESQKSGKEESDRSERAVRATENNVELAEKQFRIGNRPYFSVDVKMVKIVFGHTIVTMVHFKNVGNTPAFKVSIVSELEIIAGAFSISPKYKKIPENINTAIVAPQDTIVREVSNDKAMDRNDIQQIWGERSKVYVFGKIRYEDIFKDHHITTFCSVFRLEQDDFVFNDKYNEDYTEKSKE